MFLSDTRAWAVEMFGECELGDKRRTELVAVATGVAESGSHQFPAFLKATYALFDNSLT